MPKSQPEPLLLYHSAQKLVGGGDGVEGVVPSPMSAASVGGDVEEVVVGSMPPKGKFCRGEGKIGIGEGDLGCVV